MLSLLHFTSAAHEGCLNKKKGQNYELFRNMKVKIAMVIKLIQPERSVEDMKLKKYLWTDLKSNVQELSYKVQVATL